MGHRDIKNEELTRKRRRRIAVTQLKPRTILKMRNKPAMH